MASGDFLLEKIPMTHKPTEREIHSARLVVCANSVDRADAIELLFMLGLLND